MLLGKKKSYGKLNLIEILSDEMLQYTLEGLEYDKITIGNKKLEHTKFANIKGSLLFGVLAATLFERRIKVGDWIYERTGNRLQRFNPLTSYAEKKYEAYTLSEPFEVDVDLSKKKVLKIT